MSHLFHATHQTFAPDVPVVAPTDAPAAPDVVREAVTDRVVAKKKSKKEK